MISFAIRFTLLVALVVGLVFLVVSLPFGHKAHSQELGYFVAEIGTPGRTTGFCELSDDDGVNRVKASIGNQDGQEYAGVMSDLNTRCFDGRIFGFQPLHTEFVRVESVMQINTSDPRFCMLFLVVRIMDDYRNGTELLTWRSARFTKNGEKLTDCP